MGFYKKQEKENRNKKEINIVRNKQILINNFNIFIFLIYYRINNFFYLFYLKIKILNL